MQFHQLKPKNFRRKPKRVGRGGKRGKTSGRGTKGQKSRAGHRIRPAMRDTLKKIPKRRGYGKNRSRGVNTARKHPVAVNLAVIKEKFISDETISPAVLAGRGVVKKQGGKIPQVKILADGELDKPFVFSGLVFSKAARIKIEKAGGKIV